jgi:hypothetical protein
MGRLGVASAGAGLRRSFLGLVKGRPTLLRGFPNGLQTRRRPLPLLGLRRWGWLRLCFFCAAHLALCAAAILARPALLIVRRFCGAA